jgi:aldehyde:ferredoxin oxidoreductase
MYTGGYTGQILRINLTDQTAVSETLSEEMARNYLGGAGFAIKHLFDELPAGCDPLGVDNKLIFASGPFSGTSTPCASRMAVGTKSPLTNAMGIALTGGYFPVELKFAGYDMLIIEGRAEKPTYLWIKDGKVKFRDAADLWGTRTADCQQMIKNKLNDQNIRIACIGPAGENLSKIAAIINERRAAGRKGVGAVMGSKNLKAIALRGNQPVAVADDALFKKAKAGFATAMKESPVLYPAFSNLGTPMVVDHLCEMGILPAKNYSATGEFAPAKELGVEAQTERRIGKEHCYACPVGCTQLKLAKKGAYAGTLGEPEFESIYSLGSVTGVDNADAVVAADRLCDELGLDTMSAGVVVAFAMELYEKGILTSDATDGIDLKFGNHEAMLEMIHKMAFRDGLGDTLADGVKVAAEKIGQGSEKYAMHVKGLELPGYDVRGAKAHGLNYATSYTGADHNRGYAFQEIFGIPVPYEVDRFSTERKGELTKWNQDLRTATCDCPTMCAFLLDMAVAGNAAQNTADLMAGVTGLSLSAEDVVTVGERVNNLARAFNAREGFTRADDSLPERLMTEPIKVGGSKGHMFSREDLDTMLDEYYHARGWDIKTGTPTKEKLSALGLDYVATQLGL